MSLEKKYTSTQHKLRQHPDRLLEIGRGIYRPISIALAPTDYCQLSCQFCSVKNRDMDELDLYKAKRAMYDFKMLGAKTIEFTGGGDPTMYHGINELIRFGNQLGYEMGMISNGVDLKKVVELDKLTWLRLSLNSLDVYEDIHIPRYNGTLGFSYVWHEESNPKIFDKIEDYVKRFDAKYVRVVPNCLNPHDIKKFKDEVGPLVEGKDRFFVQTKDVDKPESCMIGYLKPFIAPDGYVYHCSATPLIGRKFDRRFQMGPVEDIYQIWDKPKPFDTKDCQTCFFKEHNEIMKQAKRGELNLEEIIMEVEHKNFI